MVRPKDDLERLADAGFEDEGRYFCLRVFNEHNKRLVPDYVRCIDVCPLSDAPSAAPMDADSETNQLFLKH